MLSRRVPDSPYDTDRICVGWSLRHLRWCLVVLAAFGCGATGSYVWVDEAPAALFILQPATVISVGDLVSVHVFGQDTLSAHERVRRDGALTLPLVGDLAVAARTPSLVAQEIEKRLKPYINDPHVTVIVEESRIRVTAIGEVGKPGVIDLDGPQGLVEALATAGGLSLFASESRIFVLRSSPQGTFRIRFDYGQITRGEGRASAFRLQNGDKIIVE